MKTYHITADQKHFTVVPENIFFNHISSNIPLALEPLSSFDDCSNHPSLKILPLTLTGFYSEDLLGFSYEDRLLGFIKNGNNEQENTL